MGTYLDYEFFVVTFLMQTQVSLYEDSISPQNIPPFSVTPKARKDIPL